MARGRMLDKCISFSEIINDLTLKEAFIYTWIIPHLDDWGRITGSPRKLKAMIFSMKKEIKVKDIQNALQKFKDIELYLWEEINGELVLQMPLDQFNEHQTITDSKRSRSKYPEIPQNPPESPRIPFLIKDKLIKDKLIKYSESSNEFRLSKLLFNKIKERNPNHKKPDLQKWAYDIDLMIRVDKRNPEIIKKIIIWCQQNDFWQNNILSTAKLREQYDQLFMKMQKDDKEINWDEVNLKEE